MIFVGIDWAEAHHDVCVLDAAGEVLATRRVSEGLEGVARLHALLGEQVARLEAELVEAFDRHPDAEILRSLPGLGDVLGPRVLAEFGVPPTATPMPGPGATSGHRTGHPGLGHEPGRRRPPRPQQAPLRRLLSVGPVRAHPLARCARPLRCP